MPMSVASRGHDTLDGFDWAEYSDQILRFDPKIYYRGPLL